MSFNRGEEYRSSYHGTTPAAEKRGRSFFRRGLADSPLGSPLFRKKQFSFNTDDPGVCLSGPSSLASSRESSLDRSASSGFHALVERVRASPNRDSSLERSSASAFHALVEKVRSSPKLGLRRLTVMRSGSFNDVGGGAKASMEAKRKKWLLGRSESLRTPGVASRGDELSNSPWSSPECERRGSLPPFATSVGSPLRERSMDRLQRLERRGTLRAQDSLEEPGGKVKGFVNR